jgi:hypothetical protein
MTAQTYIQATETDPSLTARRVWDERTAWLYAKPEAKVALGVDPWLASARRKEARRQLQPFAPVELTGCLRAVDSILHAVAVDAEETRLLVRGPRAYDLLPAEVTRLARFDNACRRLRHYGAWAGRDGEHRFTPRTGGSAGSRARRTSRR